MKNDNLLPEAFLGICFMLIFILVAVMVATQDYVPQRLDTDTNIKTKNALLDRYCATRSEYFRSKSAWCKNR